MGGKACGFDGAEDFGEVFVGVGSFIDGVFAAVGEDVGGVEIGIDGFLVEGAGGVFAAHGAASAVVDGPCGAFGAALCDHDDGAIAWVSGEEDGVSGLGEGCVGEGEVAGWDGAGGAFAVDPCFGAVDDFLAGDVVGDEVDEGSVRAWEDFLEGFEDEGVDEEVVDGGEVCADGHVVEVGVGLGGAEGCVDELAIAGGEGDVPGAEFFLEVFELALGEEISESAGSAVAEEGDVAIAEAEDVGGGACGWSVDDASDFAFAEVVSAAVGAELADFVGEVFDALGGEDEVEAVLEGVVGPVVGAVGGVLAAGGPFGRDAEGLADAFGGAFGDGEGAGFAIDVACTFDGALAAACAGGGAGDDGFDEGAAGFFVGDDVLGDVELEEGHGAFDVHADGAGVDVGWGDHDAADGCAVSGVAIGVENEVGDAGGHA